MDRTRRRVHAAWVAASVGALMSPAACAPPDAPARLSSRVPEAVYSLVSPDTVRTVSLGAGVSYRYLWSPLGPWAIHVVEADLDGRCDLALGVLRAEAREAATAGFEQVVDMAGRAGATLLAAVNADFFTPEGRPLHAEVVRGRVTQSRIGAVLAWSPKNGLWIGSSTAREEVFNAGWDVPMGRGDGWTEAVGGLPELLDAGEPVGDLEVTARPGFAASRHPRTAVGQDALSGRLWIVVVDGRQAPYSVGMTLPELTDLMKAFGATEAINLDGGGSAVMVAGGRVVSRPSDVGGRPVPNALGLRRDPVRCGLAGR